MISGAMIMIPQVFVIAEEYRLLPAVLLTISDSDAGVLMIDGRSRKHPRRGAIGSKLLEVLVQLLVLQPL